MVRKAAQGSESTSDLHLAGFIADFVQRWIQQDQHNKRITFPPLAYFIRTLDGDTDAFAVFLHELALLEWKNVCRKQFFLLGSAKGPLRLDLRQIRQLSSNSLGIQAIMYQDKTIILCNLDLINETEFNNNLRHFMVRNCYYCTSSFVFTRQEKLTAFYNNPNEVGQFITVRT